MVPPIVHDEIIRRLQVGQSIRRIATEMEVAKQTVQARKKMLVIAGQSFPFKGGKVRTQSSERTSNHAARLMKKYTKIARMAVSGPCKECGR